jgi:uncharacterized protein (DUF1810 family)
MDDRFELARFVRAQAPVYEDVLAELRAGRKRTHWMWFVFPQLAGLGASAMARQYALGSLDEARAYVAHPVLGPRLRDCAALVLAAPEADAHRIFGSPDDLKFRSCLTLFARAAPQEPVFRRGLDRFFGAAPDPRTIALLAPDRR